MKQIPSLPELDYEEFMALALEQAGISAEKGDIPVGAVIVDALGQVVATGRNQPIELNDPTAHAEIQAIREASRIAGNYRLPGHILVCTLEPCLMCAGAVIHSRLAGVVYGAMDMRTGVMQSVMNCGELDFTNHRFPVLSGVMAEECSILMRDFFRMKRAKQRATQT